MPMVRERLSSDDGFCGARQVHKEAHLQRSLVRMAAVWTDIVVKSDQELVTVS